MNINIDTILKFYHTRAQAHINCMNYFAGLLGYHFPEHDNDKNSGPMRDAYAYMNYAKYHPTFKIPNPSLDFYHDMHDEHHRMQPHHLEHYSDTRKIPDIHLIEMICDWHSANFEQNHITHEPTAQSVREHFDTKLRNRSDLKWSSHQLDLIDNTIDFLAMYADFDTVMAIWRPVLTSD